MKVRDYSYTKVLPRGNSFLLTRFWQFIWKKWLWQIFSFSADFLAKKLSCKSCDGKTTEYLIFSYSPWLFNHLLNYCSATSYLVPNCLSLALWWFWFPHDSIAIHRENSSFQRKEKQVWSNLIFKMEVVKVFNHSQTVANNSRLFDFDTSKHQKNFRYFGGFDNNHGSICLFLRSKFCVNLLHRNK